MRAFWLTAFCAIAGLIVYRRTGAFYRAFGVAFATVCVLRNFVADRPQYVTYVFLALTILILESREAAVAASAALPDLGELPRRLHHGLGGDGRLLRRKPVLPIPRASRARTSGASGRCAWAPSRFRD